MTIDIEQVDTLPNKKREATFIERAGEFFVPRPTSWGQGLLRHRWFQETANIKPTIASIQLWGQLIKENKIKTLIEYDDQTWEITEDNKKLDI
jgi:hypothetical protein